MICKTIQFNLKTAGYCDIIDITSQVEAAQRSSGLESGLCTVFIPGSTAGVTTIEAEPGAMRDLKECIEHLVPQDRHFHHDARWGDGNGFSHVRAALLGPGLSIPVHDGGLGLGTWQQIVLVDFDNRPRDRRVQIQLIGEGS
ncbi:MAG: secondary thiamine-phosphate synthase enzyme YjbQ [Candidatus Alcyoniella australis]|nr:secondary thiamine-phosphate synthase enzyme YjbQ [Candidatus Alcyoniella australis]